MKERTGFHHTKKRFLSNYRVVGAVTFIPLWYNLSVFTYNRMEGAMIGFLALPITLIITPIMLLGSVVAISANTVWGLGALPIAAIHDYLTPDTEENNTVETEIPNSTSMEKMQVLFTTQIVNQYSSNSLDGVSYGEEPENQIFQICKLEDVSEDDLDSSVNTVRGVSYMN